MARCDVCGNDYGKTMTITMSGRSGTFCCGHCAEQAGVPRQKVNA